jgi:small subunit ribosomal protein S21
MTIEVSVRNNNVDKAMRVLKKKLLKEGLMKELRDRKQFTKPSLVKREEKKQAIRRVKKEQRLKAIKDGY